MLQVVSSRPGRDENQKWWFPPRFNPKGLYKTVPNVTWKNDTFTVTARYENDMI